MQWIPVAFLLCTSSRPCTHCSSLVLLSVDIQTGSRFCDRWRCCAQACPHSFRDLSTHLALCLRGETAGQGPHTLKTPMSRWLQPLLGSPQGEARKRFKELLSFLQLLQSHSHSYSVFEKHFRLCIICWILCAAIFGYNWQIKNGTYLRCAKWCFDYIHIVRSDHNQAINLSIPHITILFVVEIL